jgi:glycerol-3-phosphate dehydrogenase
VRRYGTEAPAVVAEAGGDPALLRPLAADIPATPAELRFAVRHEGALDVADLLDRRTRIGLVPDERRRALAAAEAALEAAGATAGLCSPSGMFNRGGGVG